MKMGGTFLYFAYGSNLLSKRIHINSPSAVRVGIGKLMNYQLDFNRYSQRWRGASATIIENPNMHVWGAIWEIGLEHMDNLDKQEGVHSNIYRPLELDVILPEGETKKCRIYQMCDVPGVTEDLKKLVDERKPSAIYLNVILKGAEESNLPDYYQKFLKTVPHNGFDGEINEHLALHLTS